jgi:hypothetical protein
MAKHQGKREIQEHIYPKRNDKTEGWAFTTSIHREMKKRNIYK